MSYAIDFTDRALNDIALLKQSGDKAAIKKLDKLVSELENHPETGTGKPERLRGNVNYWSRRITEKHRLVYKIEAETITVIVAQCYGHYDDK